MSKFETIRIQGGTKKINAVVAFEDKLTGQRANEVCRIIQNDLGRGSEVVKQMWLVNMLRLPRLRHIAAEEAAAADLIIISIHDAERLPPELTAWIETWIPHKSNHDSFLLGLFDFSYNSSYQPTEHYLESVARRCRMELVVDLEERPDDR